jgi:hypothetical protein
LGERQSDVDAALLADTERQLALERDRLAKTPAERNKGLPALASLAKLPLVRQRLGDLYHRLTDGDASAAEMKLSDFELSHLGKDMQLLREILSKVKLEVSGWGGKLYFVYLPSWQRYAGIPTTSVKARPLVLRMVADLGVSIVDAQAGFDSHDDPLSLFPFRKHGHYNGAGHALVAETVINFISKARAPNRSSGT